MNACVTTENDILLLFLTYFEIIEVSDSTFDFLKLWCV